MNPALTLLRRLLDPLVSVASCGVLRAERVVDLDCVLQADTLANELGFLVHFCEPGQHVLDAVVVDLVDATARLLAVLSSRIH